MPNLKNNRGQGLVEYILILVLMGIMAIAAIQGLGTKTQAGFNKATTNLSQALGV
jgi:Flp pilus assembly pilin Flp